MAAYYCFSCCMFYYCMNKAYYITFPWATARILIILTDRKQNVLYSRKFLLYSKDTLVKKMLKRFGGVLNKSPILISKFRTSSGMLTDLKNMKSSKVLHHASCITHHASYIMHQYWTQQCHTQKFYLRCFNSDFDAVKSKFGLLIEKIKKTTSNWRQPRKWRQPQKLRQPQKWRQPEKWRLPKNWRQHQKWRQPHKWKRPQKWRQHQN